MTTFNEDFPSLKGKNAFCYNENIDEETKYPDFVIKEYCIDKQKVKDAIDKIMNSEVFSKGFYEGDLEYQIIEMKKELNL
jgi:hypothetical protein